MRVLKGLVVGLVVLLVLYAVAVVAPPFSIGVGGGIMTGPNAVLGGQVVIQKNVLPDKKEPL